MLDWGVYRYYQDKTKIVLDISGYVNLITFYIGNPHKDNKNIYLAPMIDYFDLDSYKEWYDSNNIALDKWNKELSDYKKQFKKRK